MPQGLPRAELMARLESQLEAATNKLMQA